MIPYQTHSRSPAASTTKVGGFAGLSHRRPEDESQAAGGDGNQRKRHTNPGFPEQSIRAQRLHEASARTFEVPRAELTAAEAVVAIGGVQGVTPALHRPGDAAGGL